MKKLRAAIVGCGRIGSLFSKDPLRKGIVTHAAAYINNRQTILVTACDIDSSRLEEFGKAWNIKSLYTDLGTMLSKESIDILSICTPPYSHYSVLKEAVKYRPKAIFCEKPLADDLKDAEKMVSLCAKNKVILQVGHQRRFDPLHISIKRLIDSNGMGEPRQVNFYYTAGIKNTGSHMFDLLRFFFGDVEWIKALVSKSDSGKGDDPNLDGILRFKDKTIATFQACDIRDYLIFEMNCFFEKGRLVLKDSGFSIDLYGIEKSKRFSGYNELHKIKSPLKTNYKRNFLFNGVQHLVESIRKNRQSDSSGRDGLETLRLVDSAIRSAKNKGKRIWIN